MLYSHETPPSREKNVKVRECPVTRETLTELTDKRTRQRETSVGG